MQCRFKFRHALCVAPIVGALAFAAFPGVALAAGPLPTATPCPVLGGGPCYTVAVTVGPTGEFATPPEGRVLTATAGTWTGATSPLIYQWYDCDAATGLSCNPISGATARTYTVAPSDVGSRLAIVEKAVGSAVGYSTAESTGAAVAAVPINRGAPVTSGAAIDGQTLSNNNGLWAGTQPIDSYRYQWNRCTSAGTGCVNTGVTSATYPIGDGDVGRTLEVGVEAHNSVGWGGATNCPVGVTPPCPVFSHVTAVIAPASTAAPTISGIAQQGKTLTASHGSWLPATSSVSDQWQQCDASGANCLPIPGATSTSYTLTPSDVGHTIGLQETATSNGATSGPATSAATGVVQGLPVVTPPPPPPGKNGGGSGGSTGGNTGGNTGNSGGNTGNPGPATVSSAHIHALLVKTLAPQGPGASIRTLLKKGGYVFSFGAPAPGRLVISWYRLDHGKRILVAVATVTFHKSGKATVKLALTGKGRSLLRGARKMNLVSIGVFTPVGHGATSASKNITLKA